MFRAAIFITVPKCKQFKCPFKKRVNKPIATLDKKVRK